jgi:hypothetical protein
MDSTATQSQLIADAVKRSSVAHLFHFYPVLCEIASIPRKAPSMWVMADVEGSRRQSSLSLAVTPAVDGRDETKGSIGNVNLGVDGKVVELDARVLARACLKEIGKEMGR